MSSALALVEILPRDVRTEHLLAPTKRVFPHQTTKSYSRLAGLRRFSKRGNEDAFELYSVGSIAKLATPEAPVQCLDLWIFVPASRFGHLFLTHAHLVGRKELGEEQKPVCRNPVCDGSRPN